DDWIDRVIRTADAVPAMVGVVTGGEPLSRIRQAERLIAALAATKSVVLDTSGVGEFERLVPVLRRYGLHVRVSLVSAARLVNAEGALCVEAPEGGRKISWRYLDAEGHASRYLNGTLEPFPQPIGAVFPG